MDDVRVCVKVRGKKQARKALLSYSRGYVGFVGYCMVEQRFKEGLSEVPGGVSRRNQKFVTGQHRVGAGWWKCSFETRISNLVSSNQPTFCVSPFPLTLLK